MSERDVKERQQERDCDDGEKGVCSSVFDNDDSENKDNNGSNERTNTPARAAVQQPAHPGGEAGYAWLK
jgi:hypothetical protein